MSRFSRAMILLLVLWAADCRSTLSDPPPAREKFEVPIAPPGAVGARAAGTDAAPGIPTELPGWGNDEAQPEPELDADAGAMIDAGGVAL